MGRFEHHREALDDRFREADVAVVAVVRGLIDELLLVLVLLDDDNFGIALERNPARPRGVEIFAGFRLLSTFRGFVVVGFKVEFLKKRSVNFGELLNWEGQLASVWHPQDGAIVLDLQELGLRFPAFFVRPDALEVVGHRGRHRREEKG